ncbi:MAG TPA: DinB family protein [Vicinamibacterales bacterium]|nr:DinB family protein [Vicinamibacterales bacterium]
MLPQELQDLIDQIDACEADAERLVADLDDEAVNWTPPSGGWSVAQCLSHLALMNDYYLRGWSDAVAEAARAERGPFTGLQPTLFGRRFVSAMEPPYTMKGKAVQPATPASRVPRDTVVQDYKQSHETYRHLVRASAAVDVNRVVRPNAIMKQVKMRLSTVLLIIPAHDRRHLWQAANVKARRAG